MKEYASFSLAGVNMELSYYLWNQTQSASEAASRIVLLHGMGGTGALWRPLAASLENKMQVLAPDQRGHGKSRIPHIPGSRQEVSYTPLDYGRDVVDTLESIQFHPTWILGHSMGVRSAVAAAHLKREWVQGLFLIDLGFSGVAGGGLGENLATFLKKLPTDFSSREEARQFMNDHCPDPSIAQYLMAVSVREPNGRLTFPFDHSALIQTIHAARDVSVRKWVQDLGSQGMPVHILRGANSLVWTHEEFEKEKETFAPYPSIQFHEFANAGHGLPFEQRLLLVKLIEEALISS
jgi:pimeloyl-ACP methyl ester carboxylesterase